MLALEESTIRSLIDAARTVMKNSYCPYSKFPVGAALLCADGSIYTGCNIENCTFSSSICAERTAYARAVIDGHRQFKAIAISANIDYCSPCGVCRQFMAEFGVEIQVITFKHDQNKEPSGIQVMKLDELLPQSFGPSSLSI